MKHLILVKFETNLKTYMKRSDICWKLQNFMISDELDPFSYRQISIKCAVYLSRLSVLIR